MWEIIFKSTSYEDAPVNNRTFLDGFDTSRVAYWIVRNNQNGVEIPLHLYLPLNAKTVTKVIFSIHGRYRNGSKNRDIFVQHVQDKNVLIVAPEFSQKFFSSSWASTTENMRSLSTSDELLNEVSTFNIIDEVFSLLATDFPKLQKYSLFGHSAGAQFVHRFVLYTDQGQRLDKAVAVNAGWYTILDKKVEFPYGIKDLMSDKKIRQVLARKLLIIAGEDDIIPDEYVRATKQAMRQGTNRYERAHYAYRKASQIAQTLQCPMAWTFISVPGLNHNSQKAVDSAVHYLFDIA